MLSCTVCPAHQQGKSYPGKHELPVCSGQSPMQEGRAFSAQVPDNQCDVYTPGSILKPVEGHWNVLDSPNSMCKHAEGW